MLQLFKLKNNIINMTERNDFYDNLINQQELFNEKMQKYTPLVEDLKTAPSPEDTKIIIDTIKNLALHECDVKFLDYIREYLISEWIKQSGKIKMRFYSASAWITNDFKECWYNFDNLPAKIETTNNISENEIINEDFPNFKVESGSAIINWKDYNLNLHPDNTPIIKKIWDNEYSMNLVFLRNSNSSMRWPENIEIKFNYDWENIIFFWDKNRNDNFDKNEYWRLYKVDDQNYTKIIPQTDGTTIIKTFDTTQNITLWKEHLNHYWVDEVKFTIEF